MSDRVEALKRDANRVIQFYGGSPDPGCGQEAVAVARGFLELADEVERLAQCQVWLDLIRDDKVNLAAECERLRREFRVVVGKSGGTKL